MPGIPFRSKLQPHVETIVAMRRKGETWAAIAAHLTAKGCATDPGSVCRFLGRWERRPYARGMGPAAKPSMATPQPPAHREPQPPPAVSHGSLSPEELVEEAHKPAKRVMGKATKGF